MTQVQTGLDLLVSENFKRLKNLNLGLLAHPASVSKNLDHILDLCLKNKIKIKKLFGPEHGFWGNAQDMESINNSIDNRTGLPIMTLYGESYESLKILPENLENLDAVICDLQDIGTRYYTYSYSIAFMLQACAKAKIKCFVINRPNPLGGVKQEGNLVLDNFKSFVGEYPLKNRHGLTIGELAKFFKQQDKLDLDLEIINLSNWNRQSYFDQTGLPWIAPSPNMPTPETALVYPGSCLFEGTNLSEGRGTTKPFELVGASYIKDPDKFVKLAESCDLSGVKLRPCYFTPKFHKHANQLCGGLQIHITNREKFNSLKTGMGILWAARQFKGFDWRREPYEFVADKLAIDLLFGTDKIRKIYEQNSEFENLL